MRRARSSGGVSGYRHEARLVPEPRFEHRAPLVGHEDAQELEDAQHRCVGAVGGLEELARCRRACRQVMMRLASRCRHRQPREHAAQAGERRIRPRPRPADAEPAHVGRVPHAARLQDRDPALEAALDLHVLQLDHVVGGERDPMAGELGRAQEVRDLHVHVEGDAARREMLGERVDELLEPPVGGNAERHAGQAVEHGAPRSEPLHLLPRPIEEAVGRELDRRDVAEASRARAPRAAGDPIRSRGDARGAGPASPRA